VYTLIGKFFLKIGTNCCYKIIKETISLSQLMLLIPSMPMPILSLSLLVSRRKGQKKRERDGERERAKREGETGEESVSCVAIRASTAIASPPTLPVNQGKYKERHTKER